MLSKLKDAEFDYFFSINLFIRFLVHKQQYLSIQCIQVVLLEGSRQFVSHSIWWKQQPTYLKPEQPVPAALSEGGKVRVR